MWQPRRFFRNLCAYSFAALLVNGIIYNVFGAFLAALTLVFVPVMVAAAREGLFYASERQHFPEPVDLWWVSREMAEVYLSFLAIISVLLAISVDDFRLMFAHGNILLIFCVFGVLTGTALAVVRWSYAFGVKLEIEHGNNNAG